ncbi:MAG: tetratricopeptide repeat protein, partial [Pseudomonadota bacterium]
MTRLFRLVFPAIVVLGLAACQSAEERAEEHYQSALALLEEGDLARATVEFRNVFELNGTHVEARRAYAAAIREAGRTQEAYSQFLRLVEQRPDDVDGRIALTEMAIDAQNWDQARTHGSRAVTIAADDPRLPPIEATLSYLDAVEAEDAEARQDASQSAADALADDPDNLGLRQILIDNALRNNDSDVALEQIAAALEIDPDNRSLYDARLTILAENGDVEAIEAQLLDMVTRFPADGTLTATLLRFYVSRGELDAAEAFLRDRIAVSAPGDNDLRMALVQFVLQRDGAEAALDELDTFIETAAAETSEDGSPTDAIVFRILRAGIRFDTGARAEAIAELQGLIDADEGPRAELNDARVALARMLSVDGNPVGGRRLVGEVLESDPAHVEALKLEAGWFIDEDRPDAAIARLRTALEEAPDDVAAMTLMARAHERNGSRDLMRDFLALAYETSGFAPDETLRYVRILTSEERYLPAEEALIAALRIAPDTPALLEELGRLYISMEDWPRAEHVENTLRRIEGMGRLADDLRVQRLAASGDMDDAIVFLEQLASQGDDQDLGADVAVIRARLASGDIEGATAYLEERLAETPDNFTLRFVQASIWSGTGRYEEAAT